MTSISLKEENYLKSIINLSYKNETVGVKQISEDLKLKMPTVNAMMKKLSAKGLVNYETYKPITLTKKGKLMALSVIRKHRLTEMFLVQIMGLGWEEVHDIAEQLEHIKSPIFFDQMDKILGFPDFDPHGSPIPNAQGQLPQMNLQYLSEVAVGDSVLLKAVTSSSYDFLVYLNEKNISIGQEIKVLQIEKFDQSMTVLINEQLHVLSNIVTQKLLIEYPNGL